MDMEILKRLRTQIIMTMQKAQHARDAGRVPSTNTIDMTFAEADEVRKAIERVLDI